METLINCVVNSLVISSMYILVAVGFALLLSIMGIFNFAHGAVYMIGAYVTYGLSVVLGLNNWVALPLSIIIVGLFGLFLERFCFRPFIGKPTNVIVMAVALILILETAVEVTLGGVTRSIPPFVSDIVQVGPVSIDAGRLAVLLIGAVLLIAMNLFIHKSKLGQQMLAVAQNKVGAALQGININRTAAIATMMACGMAALSGTLMSTLHNLSPFMGNDILLKVIQVVILSGIGSVGGILAGGLIIGSMDAVLPVFMDAHIADLTTIVVVIVILLVRPKGLFGYELF